MIFGVAIAAVVIVVIYRLLRNKKVNETGIETGTVIFHIDTDTQNAEGRFPMHVKYLPEKPKYVCRIK